jgi:carbamoyl-phosphate synthase large subunit
VPILAAHRELFEAKGVALPISDLEPIEIANDKFKMYEVLREKTEISLPAYRLVTSLDQFLEAAEELGYPDRSICFKPPVAKGSRGFRILDPHIDRKDLLLNYKPNSRYMSLNEFEAIFQGDPAFPKFLVMEYLEGMEYTTDPIALNGEMLLCTTKTVEAARWGVIVKGQLVDKPGLVEQTREILKAIPLSYNVNIQFIGDKLIEINPRVSSFIYQDDLIAPYVAIKLALAEITPDDVRRLQSPIEYGRRMVRYMDQVFWTPTA